MKIVKNIGLALLVIIAISLVVLYFMPNEYKVSNSVEINKPAELIYAQVYDFNKWGTWDPWAEMDPNAKYTFEGAPGKPGHRMSWDSKKIGVGSLTIKSAGVNEHVYSQLEFTKPFKLSAKDMILLEPNGDKTKVTWTTSGGLSFPKQRIMGLFMDKMLGADQRKGLEKLKNFVEAMPVAPLTASADSTTKSM